MPSTIQPIRVVIDTNVFISAAGSRKSNAWQCFIFFARREFRIAVTGQVLLEYETVARTLAEDEGIFYGMHWRPLFDWVRQKADYFEPAALGKPRSRDAKDDAFLACALAAQAKILVSYDADLLDLEKPFGIDVLKPVEFVRFIKYSRE